MKLPRNVHGEQLAKALERVGYHVHHQRGSHIRLITDRGGRHFVVVPAHRPVKLGTLSAILNQVAEHLSLTREELLEALKL